MAELIWDGKYKDGENTAPVRIALPFQTIETVNESVQHEERTIWRNISDKENNYNRLIWGDKKYVLPSLLPELAGKVKLIYIDPPFDTGANFSFTATIPDNPETDEDETTKFVKQPSLIEQKAYRDTWGKGIDSYAQWFYETAIILRDLLSEDGSIFVHLDWHVSHYAKAILDEVFGYENFKNEVIWQRTTNTGSSKGIANKLSTDSDSILYYTRSAEATFNKIYKPYAQEYLARFKFEDNKGKYRWQYMATYSEAKLRELQDKDMVRFSTGSKPEYKQYLKDLKGIPLNNLWYDIFHVNPMAKEKVNYNTQKPVELLTRIITLASNEGDTVLDCFVGSGTTAVAAELLKRRWIACDLGRFAIHTTRKRLLSLEHITPFIVQNLGKYERQQWMQSEFDDPESKIKAEQRYRKFIINLFHGDSLEGHTWLHGLKNGRMIHIGSVGAPVTVEDIKSTIIEYWQLVNKADNKGNKGIDFLGWDFAFDVNQTAQEFALSNKVDIHFKKIPREVLERKAVEQGDIRFYELAYLEIKHKVGKHRKITIDLLNFIVPTDDIPTEVQCKITHWSQWIDYWAVDWDYQDDTFHNQWQSYRTKQDPQLALRAVSDILEPGTYTVVIKVIDLLGNDTTKSVQIEV